MSAKLSINSQDSDHHTIKQQKLTNFNEQVTSGEEQTISGELAYTLAQENKNYYNFSQEIQEKNSHNTDKLFTDDFTINQESVNHIESFMQLHGVLGKEETLNEEQLIAIYEVHFMEGEEGEQSDKQVNIRKGLVLRKYFTHDQIRVLMEGKVCGPLGKISGKIIYTIKKTIFRYTMKKDGLEIPSDNDEHSLINAFSLFAIRTFSSKAKIVESYGIPLDYSMTYFLNFRYFSRDAIERYCKLYIAGLKTSMNHFYLRVIASLTDEKIDIAIKILEGGFIPNIDNFHFSYDKVVRWVEELVTFDQETAQKAILLKTHGYDISFYRINQLKYVSMKNIVLGLPWYKKFKENDIHIILKDMDYLKKISTNKIEEGITFLKDKGFTYITMYDLVEISLYSTKEKETLVYLKNIGYNLCPGDLSYIKKLTDNEVKHFASCIKILKQGQFDCDAFLMQYIVSLDIKTIETAVFLKRKGVKISKTGVEKCKNIPQKSIDTALSLCALGISVSISDIISVEYDMINEELIDRAAVLLDTGFPISMDNITTIPSDKKIIDYAVKQGKKLKVVGKFLSFTDIENFYEIDEQYFDLYIQYSKLAGSGTPDSNIRMRDEYGNRAFVRADRNGFVFPNFYYSTNFDKEYLASYIQWVTFILTSPSNNSFSSSIEEALDNPRNYILQLIKEYALLEVGELDNSENSKKIKEYMEGPGKHIAYEYVNNLLGRIIENMSVTKDEIGLMSQIEKIGVGNLGQVETLFTHCSALSKFFIGNYFIDKKTTKSLHEEGKTILKKQKKRSQEQTNDFYGIGNELLKIAPSLYSDLLKHVATLSYTDFNYFLKNIYPMYHVEVILSQDEYGNNSGRRLVGKRNAYNAFFQGIQENLENKSLLFRAEEERLHKEITILFQERFGIKKIPEVLTKTNVETIKNYSLYLANMNDSDGEKESIVSFFLALKINNKWDAFREGATIAFKEYVNNKHAREIEEYLEERSKKDHFKGYEEVTKKKIQSSELSQIVGDFTTIDEILHGIDQSFDQLLDKDLYSKEMGLVMNVLVKNGKETGKALAMKFQQLQGKLILLTQEQELIIEEIGIILGVDMGTTEGIKKTQGIVKSISPIVNIVNKAKDIDIPGKINELEKRLLPDQKLLELFNSWGVEMTTSSSVIATLDDVQYLEVLLSKNEHELSEEQIVTVRLYLGAIQEYLLVLHKDAETLTGMFTQFKENAEKGNNELLKKRLNELSVVFETENEGEQKIIISELTTDLDVVIKNIRACLSCKTKGQNNDTNLTFGESNKFFVISHRGKNEKSYADQLVHYLESDEGKLFVMDTIYGKKTPDILTNHIFTVCNKLKKIGSKEEGVFISKKILRQSSLTQDHLLQKLEEYYEGKFFIKEASPSIEIDKGVGSDGYYEFASDQGRVHGTYVVPGIIVALS